MFIYIVINILIEIYYLYNIYSYNNIFITKNDECSIVIIFTVIIYIFNFKMICKTLKYLSINYNLNILMSL